MTPDYLATSVALEATMVHYQATTVHYVATVAWGVPNIITAPLSGGAVYKVAMASSFGQDAGNQSLFFMILLVLLMFMVRLVFWGRYEH